MKTSLNARLALRSVVIFTILTVMGCASAQKNFDNVTPGMSEKDVRSTMGGPSRFESISETNYTAWHWGEDYCVLFKDNKVVGKDASQAGKNASLGPAKYEEKQAAQCLAPGQTATTGNSRTINIPGVGKIQLPLSKIQPSG